MLKRLMSEMTWMEVRDAVNSGSGVILPIGATEQHGPHMPLCTDALLSERMAHDVAKETNLIVAPTVCYGFRSRPCTGGGQTFPGTTSVSGSTLTAIIMDVVKEFIRTGFRKIVLFNWHFENSNFIYDAAYNVYEDRKQEYPDLKLIIIETPFSELKPETMEYVFEGHFPGWGIEHASIFETSVMMYVAPELVDFSKAIDDKAEYYPFYDMLPIPKRITTESGILWKASLATKDKGEVLWKEISQNLIESVNMEFKRWEKEN
ncbi:creatinine amidohydrolase [Neobacillus niacini]|uniref:creatininase n=1 Tax=Neobacillus niacini TaxID=86668 RepID=UPI00286130D1|nr:creatininase [Neobacillus niacini]MDR7079755.1 creatinine amidohydrolase [Neobacillus niacini]